METTPKIRVFYSPKDAVSEAETDLQKIEQATCTEEYSVRDFSDFQTLLQRIAKDFNLRDGNVALVDDDGNRVGPEILETSDKLTELKVEGSGPVAASIRPRERVWGKIKTMNAGMTYPNVLEELIENSLDAIDMERDKTEEDFPGKIVVTTNRKKQSIRIADNGCGMQAKNMENIMALGNDDDYTGSGNGEYNIGMKCVTKCGMQEIKLVVSIMSKIAASTQMVQVQLPLKNVKDHGEWRMNVGKVDPEPTLFGTEGLGDRSEPPFPGRHGTVVTLHNSDKVVFKELCVSETDPTLKCLAKLAAKYCFRTTGAADFLHDALDESGACSARPLSGTFNTNFSPIDIFVDKDCLRQEDNVVLQRLLDMLAKSDDRKAAREQLCSPQSGAEKSATAGAGRGEGMPAKGRWKPLWFSQFEVETEASGQLEIGVVKVVAFFDSPQDEPGDEDGEPRPDSGNRSQKQVMVFWNGVFFENASLELPWFNKAKKDKSNSRQVQDAYERVKLFVFLDKAFRPDVHKQILISGSLYTELCTDSKHSKNSKTFQNLKKAMVDTVSEWFAADVKEEYGPVHTRKWEDSQYMWEHVDLKLSEGAPPTSKTGADTQASKTKAGASVMRQKQGKIRLVARGDKKGKKTKGSFVEFEAPGSGNSGRTAKTILFGTITHLMTTESEPITSGAARIDVPFAEPMEVPVSKITRLLTPDEEKARMDLVKDSMPNDIAIHVCVGDEKPKNGKGSKPVNLNHARSGPLYFLQVHNSTAHSSTTGRAASGTGSNTKPLEMTADQARDFLLMVDVNDAKGNLVKDGGDLGHAKNSVINLKNLTCRTEVWDRNRSIALPHPRTGKDWVDIVQAYDRNEGARYFSDKKQPSITDFFENVGEYRIKVFFAFRDFQEDGSDSDEGGSSSNPRNVESRVFHGQRRSVQELLDEKFHVPGEPGCRAGLHGSLDINIIPGKPWKATGKVDGHYWLGDPQPLRDLSIKDQFDNALPPETITGIDVGCITDALTAEVQGDGSEWKMVIEGVEGHALPAEEVDVDFDVHTSWTDTSTIAKALGGRGAGCSGAAGRTQTQPGTLRFRGKVQIYSGLPHSVTITPAPDMIVTELPRGQPLNLSVHVKDRWGNSFKGKKGQLTLHLVLQASEGMTSSQQLSILDLERGEVKLPEKLKVMVEGDYQSTGTLTFTCKVQDMRGGKLQCRDDIKAENTLDIKVEEARLVFVVPEKFGQSSEDVDLEIKTQDLPKLLNVVKLQVQRPSGAVMKVDDGSDVCLSKNVAGDPEAKQLPSVPVRRGEAIVQLIDPEKLDETMSCTVQARFHGLQAKLHLCVMHGALQSVSVVPETEREVMIGKEWAVFFTVLDAANVVITDPNVFALSLECDDGLEIKIKDESVAFDHEQMAFRAIAVPAGCSRSETNKAKVRLHVRPADALGDVPPPPPESMHDDGLCPELRLEASIDIVVKAENAEQLEFFSSGKHCEEHDYESGQSLDLCIRAVDQYGNVDKSFNGRIEITVVDFATDPSDPKLHKVDMQGGILFMNRDKWRQFTKAKRVELKAAHVGKQKTKKTHTLAPATCLLNVSPGSWAERIKVLPHPLLGDGTKKLVIDDSDRALAGFKACVIANDGTSIPNAQLEARLVDSVYKSRPNPTDPSVLEFEPMKVPLKEGEWSLELRLVDHGATRRPPDPGIRVRRTPGTPSSFTLRAELDHLRGSLLQKFTVCAGKHFSLHVEAKNKLGEVLSLKELLRQDELFEVQFELQDRSTGIALEYPQGPGNKETFNSSVGVREIIPDLCEGITTSVVGCAVFQRQRMYTNPVELTFHPRLEVQKNTEAFNEVEDAKNEIQKKLETTRKTQASLKAKHRRATTAVDNLQKQLDEFPPAQVLQSQLNAAAAICESRKGKTFLSEPDPRPKPAPWTRAYEDALQQGLQPEARALGVAAGLGYVHAEGDQALFAEGISALVGSDLQAVVLPAERDFAQWHSFAAAHQIRTLVMTPLSNSEKDRVSRARDHPPAGAHSALSKIKVDEICVADQVLQKRLVGELWAKLLLDALIFETYAQMQAYRAQHGRTHRMAARREDGTWCVADVGEVPGQDAPRYVKLRVLVPGESTAEYMAAEDEVKNATHMLAERKKLEDQLSQKLAAAQGTQDDLDKEACEATIDDLEAQMKTLEDKEAALRGSSKELSARVMEELKEGTERANKRAKKGPGGEGGGSSSSSRASGKHPRQENQETPQRNTRQRGIASPSAASASRNLNLRAAAGGRVEADP